MTSQTVASYIAKLPVSRRTILNPLRNLILSMLPDAVETMRYKMPTYELEDPVCAIASQKHYVSVYFMDTAIIERHRSQLAGLNPGKSCIRLTSLTGDRLDVIRSMLREIK